MRRPVDVARPALAFAAAAVLLVTAPGCLAWQESPLDYRAMGRKVVPLEGVEVRFDLKGPAEAPPVVMVHGFGASLETWDRLAPALWDDHRVLRLDLPGFGLSSKYDSDYRPETQARRVLAAMDRVGIDRADLVAHSMGSVVALVMAGLAPERVRGLVLFSPWVYAEQLPWGFRTARAKGLGELIFGVWYAEHLDARFRFSFHDPDRWVTEALVEDARAAIRMPGTRAAALAVIRALGTERLQRRYHLVRTPTLIVQGREDRVARVEYAERLSRQLPDARLHVVPHCGHFPMAEAQEAVATRVRDWLAR